MTIELGAEIPRRCILQSTRVKSGGLKTAFY